MIQTDLFTDPSTAAAEAAWAEVEKPKQIVAPPKPTIPPFGHLAGQYWTCIKATYVKRDHLHRAEDAERSRMHFSSRRLWTFDENPCDWVGCHAPATHAAKLHGMMRGVIFCLYCPEHFERRPPAIQTAFIDGDVVAALKVLGIEEWWAQWKGEK